MQIKPFGDKSNNQSRATIIFDDLINRRKTIMNELYNNVNYNNLKFEYIGPTKYVSFYEYRDSKELLNAIKKQSV